MNIPSNQLLALFNKTMRKIRNRFKLIVENNIKNKLENAQNTSNLKNLEGKRKSAEAKEKEESEIKDSEKPKLLISPSKKKKLENKTNLN